MSDTPIHDALLWSNRDYAQNPWLNPFRVMTWQGQRLSYLQTIEDDGHREDNFS